MDELISKPRIVVAHPDDAVRDSLVWLIAAVAGPIQAEPDLAAWLATRIRGEPVVVVTEARVLAGVLTTRGPGAGLDPTIAWIVLTHEPAQLPARLAERFAIEVVAVDERDDQALLEQVTAARRLPQDN